MVKMDILDYGVYANGAHIADFDDVERAIGYAAVEAHEAEVNTIVVCNFTGELVAEYTIKTEKKVVEWLAE